MNLHAAVISHVGRVRSNNEDNFYLQGQIRQDVEQLNSRAKFSGADTGVLFAVADGMGGEAKGEFASLEAVKTLRPSGIDQARTAATRSINRANAVICREMDRAGCRMGTTLVALYLDKGRAVVCNVGDSRAYRVRGGRSEEHTSELQSPQ